MVSLFIEPVSIDYRGEVSMDTISAWLAGIGLGQYTNAFMENGVDLDVLSDLSEPDLEKLGVVLGHRKRMLRAISAERAAGASDQGNTVPLPARKTQCDSIVLRPGRLDSTCCST